LHADCSIPLPRDQPIAQVFRQVVFLDRLLDRALLVRRVINGADELRQRTAGPKSTF
jgi:hypothetical protein